ncbi:MAG: type VI secretion system tip protein VgrG [Planctomycetota bacterium]|nr:MAG: type VI secretion system tip protein VgrG [Planctomycetota bacterium]
MPEDASSGDAAARRADTADFLFTVGDLAADELKVARFTGRERLSRLFQFDVSLVSDNADLSPADLVGQACKLEIRGSGGTRFVHGIVRRFARDGEGVNLTKYSAVIVPKVWLLSRRIRCRIFQEHNCSDMTVPGIIRKVLIDAGLTEDDFRFALEGEYPTREYVVQYRESEMDFISRLAEKEGIFFYFEHTEEGHKIVFGDGVVSYGEHSDGEAVPFRDPSGLVSEEDREQIISVRDEHEVRIGSVALDDYNFKQPAVDLLSESTGDEFTSLEYFDYPGAFLDREDGGRYAQLRLEAFQARRRTQAMAGDVRRLLPGYKFTLEDHPNDELNGEYLTVSVEHAAAQPQSGEEEAGEAQSPQYEARITTIPADIVYRPPLRTPRPTIAGTQTATVVGPQGEEIYTDEYGRVKVQFRWDREGQYDENSSCWIRVSQGSAGGQYGMMFLPRVGQEVIVEHIDGDPDRPIITGRVYNNDLMPPYTLPDEKTKSCIKTNSSKGGGGTNEIRFEDKKGEEQLLLHAEKDYHLRVTNCAVETVGGDASLGVGHDRIVKIANDQSIKIEGKESIEIAGTRSVTIDGDVVETFNGNHKETVGQTLSLRAMSVKIEADTCIELVCGDSSVVLTPAAVFINGTLVNLNSGSGPPVGPVAAAATPTSDPASADDVEPGYDVTYSGGEASQATEGDSGEQAGESDDEDRDRDSWIRIKLVDEEGNPVPGERYRVTCPDGTVKEGSLDANGRAYISGIDPGNCDITFPELDQSAWRRNTETVPQE